MFSRFFIDRPIFATVLAVLMIIAGLVTVKTLPVAQFPDITPPTVKVSAVYPGADAKTVAETIGVPIEEQVNGVEGMMYMSSNCGSDGSYGLTITFEVGTDLDEATVKVQNRIAMAESQLPYAVQQQGISVMSESTNIIMFIALESDDPDMYDALYLTNYAQLNIVNELSRLEGVGGVSAFGAGEYSMRIWLDPEIMRIRDITPQDVTEAIRSQNMEVPAGSVGAPPTSTGDQFQHFTRPAKDCLAIRRHNNTNSPRRIYPPPPRHRPYRPRKRKLRQHITRIRQRGRTDRCLPAAWRKCHTGGTGGKGQAQPP